MEVEKKNQKKFEAMLKSISFGLIGCVAAKKDFRVFGLDGNACISADLAVLKEAWQKPLRW